VIPTPASPDRRNISNLNRSARLILAALFDLDAEA